MKGELNIQQCYPSWRRHLFTIVSKNKKGEANRIKCVHCDQYLTGPNQCAKAIWRYGLEKGEEQ